MKTSTSYPLRIDPVSVPEGGTIGLTLCSGKVQMRSMAGPWDRDLGADLDRIAGRLMVEPGAESLRRCAAKRYPDLEP